MTFFVSWGVNTVGEAAQPFTPAAQQTYHRRKVRDGELKTARAQGAGDEGTRMDKATGRNEVSSTRDLPRRLLTVHAYYRGRDSLRQMDHRNRYPLSTPPRRPPNPLCLHPWHQSLMGRSTNGPSILPPTPPSLQSLLDETPRLPLPTTRCTTPLPIHRRLQPGPKGSSMATSLMKLLS